MIKTISVKIARKVCIAGKYDTEVMTFGLEILLSTVTNILLIVAIAYAAGFGNEMMLYITAFGVLRISAGGYHSRNHILCFITYLAISTAGIMFVRFVPQELLGYYITALLTASMILIYTYAPTQTANRPIYPNERKRFKKRSIFTLFALAALTGGLVGFGFSRMALVVTTAVFTESLTLIHKKNEKLEGESL